MSGASKFKDNKFANSKPQMKSRNKEQQIGMNPAANDMMFFNSNREKSPIPDADGNVPETSSVVLSDVTKDTKANSSIDSKNSVEPENFAGTGESGMPKQDKPSEKAKEADKKPSRSQSKMSSKVQPQASLKNKNGEFCTVIQEVEREFNMTPKANL